MPFSTLSGLSSAKPLALFSASSKPMIMSFRSRDHPGRGDAVTVTMGLS